MSTRSQLDLDSIVLSPGAHSSPEEGMCAMEAVAWLAGEDWSDGPACTSPVIAAFVRSWNDALPDDERQQLRRYIPRLVGTNAGRETDDRLAWMAADWLVRVHAPAWLRLAGLTEQAALVEGMPEVTAVTAPSIKAPLAAVRQAAAAARDAAGVAARDAAWDAAWDAARVAAGDAAADAAWVAAAAAAWDAAREAAWHAARDAAWDAAWVAAARAAGDATRVAARVAARNALDPTMRMLQQYAHELLDRMITVTEEVDA